MTQSPEAALADEYVRAVSDWFHCKPGSEAVLAYLAANRAETILAALRAKPAGDGVLEALWPFAIHAQIFKDDADEDVADLAGHSLIVSDFRRAAAALAQLPADQPTQAIDIGSTMPEPFYKTGEDIGGLKACPTSWCDHEQPPIVYRANSSEWQVFCRGQCGVETPYFRSEAEAIAAWNTRKENGRG